jgi:tetratricopeptide (TPR) repeat protein
MLLARSPSDEGFLNGFQRTEENISYLRQALDYHKQYVHTGDKGGKFVANINIGLCHGALGEFTAAAKHYQEALRVAIQMQTLYGQSIAVGNLGMIVMNKKDYGTARTCFEQVVPLICRLLSLMLVCSTCNLSNRCTILKAR